MQKILIIGCGLVGFSFAKAIKGAKPKCDIIAFDKDDETVSKALESGIAKEYYDFSDPLKDIDLVVIASPLSTYPEIFTKIHENIEKSPIIDLGSLNEYPLSIIDEGLSERFISCHPIAGSEKSGIDNSDSEIFRGKKFIASFTKNSNIDKNTKVLEDITKIIGSDLQILDKKEHDKIFALISHLPQFLSFLSNDVSPALNDSESLKRAFRLDSSNPAIWSDIFEINSKNIESYYSEFFNNLCDMIEAIDSGNYNLINQEISKNSLMSNGNLQDINKITELELSKQNFAKTLFRLIIVLSYVKIKDVSKFSNYAGSGFGDFTLIVNFFKGLDPDFFSKSLSMHKSKIFNYFDKIST